MHDLQEISNRVAHRLTGYLLYHNVFFVSDNTYDMNLLLTDEKNFGGNYTLGNKDMRFYVSNINVELKDYNLINDFTFVKKPKPLYITTKYLNNRVRWNMGYDINKILIRLNVN